MLLVDSGISCLHVNNASSSKPAVASMRSLGVQGSGAEMISSEALKDGHSSVSEDPV